MLLLDRVCLVTGAARGIGAALVRAFLAEGASVAATDLDLPALESSLAGVSPDRVLVRRHDVSSEADWEQTVGAASQRFGGLDVLVNNAGMFLFASIDSMTLAQWRRISAVNLDSVFLGTQHGARLMKDAERRQRCTGSIINLSSVAGMRGSPNLSAYGMTKGGVRLFTKSAAAEYGPHNIRVNSIHPGVIETDMGMSAARARMQAAGEDVAKARASGANNLLGRIGAAEDVARMAVYLASDASSFVTGAEMVVDGGLSAR